MTRIRIVASAVLWALATSLAAPLGAPAQSAPIKIGFLAPLTGPFAQIGKDMVNGNQLYLAEIGGQVAGRKIEVLVEDDEGNPATALNKARKLVDQDRIAILTGGMLANVGYALQPYIDAQKIPATFPVIAADDMDYAFGYEIIGGFQQVFEEGGGQIVQRIWAPLNTNDFAPFLAQIRRDADAVLALFTGRLAL